MKRIISLDGGGLRGLITAHVLDKLEQQTGKLIRESFDFVAGSSTGALQASAICAGIPAAKMIEVYTTLTAKVFTPQGPLADAAMVARGHKYDISNLRKVLEEVFGTQGTWTLNDSPIRLLLCARGANGHGWFFVQDRPRNAQTTGKLSLLDCATASAAAPTYFDPWYVAPLGGNLVGWCFDGGVGIAANPVYAACVEAFQYDDFLPAQTRVVSLGTGFYPGGSTTPPAGLIPTIEWTIDTILDAVNDEQTRAAQLHWPGVIKRFNWELPTAIAMDDLASIPELTKIGMAAAENFDWQAALGE